MSGPNEGAGDPAVIDPALPKTPASGVGDEAKGKGGIAPKGDRTGLWNYVVNNVPVTALLGVAVLVLLILLSVFVPYIISGSYNVKNTLLRELADTEMARGLITFLVAVSTVGIALTLVVYIATSSVAVPEIKERFAFSKEVLTSLIGILGTIIGFYFGATQGQTHGPSATTTPALPTTLALENAGISPPKLVKDGTVFLHATLSGGQGPYTYSISFTPDIIKELDRPTPNGTISEEIKP